jgi:Root hair defective 3 GTP-binding protein (RHD3)
MIAEIKDFREQASKIITEALSHFDYTARQYNPEVVKQFRHNLLEHLNQQLKMSFDNQVQVIQGNVLESFTKEITKLEQQPLENVASKLSKVLNSLLEAKVGSFQRHTEALIIEGFNWEKLTLLTLKQLQANLADLCRNCKDKFLIKLQQTS